MKAKWKEQVIAESDRTVELDGYHYFPRAAVRMELLTAAPKTDDDRLCPHGVQFYDIVSGGKQGERAAWSYEAPRPSMEKVAQLIAFWGDVALLT